MSEFFDKAYHSDDPGIPLSILAEADTMRDALDCVIEVLGNIEGFKQSDNEKLALLTFALREVALAVDSFVDNCNGFVKRLKEENRNEE